MSDLSADMAVMAVTLVGWVGIFLAIMKLNSKVKKLEDR